MTLGKSLISSIRRASSLARSAGWIVVLIFLQACSEVTPVEYSSFAAIGPDGIPKDWEYEFSPVPADSADIGSKLFDIVLTVRFNNRCASRNVILDMEEISLAHPVPDSLRVKIPLFDSQGRPLGEGNYGLFEVSDTIRRSVPLQEGYVIAVSSPLPKEETVGINAIGIIAVPVGSVSPINQFWQKIKFL